MLVTNFWLGCNELIIVYREGTHHVIEDDENWDDVFTGTYKECLSYCKNRVKDYEESIIG